MGMQLNAYGIIANLEEEKLFQNIIKNQLNKGIIENTSSEVCMQDGRAHLFSIPLPCHM